MRPIGALVPYASNSRTHTPEQKISKIARNVEACEAEVNPRFAQIANFEREHLEIPAGVERQLVVGEHIAAALRRREVRQDDARHLVEAEQMRGEHLAVAGDNAVLFVDQHRVGEAKFADRRGDLRDLLVAVRARVSRVADQRRAPAPNNRLGECNRQTAPLLLFNVKSSRHGCGNRSGAGSYLKQNYEMLAERARGLLSGEVSRPDEHETRRHTIYWLQ